MKRVRMLLRVSSEQQLEADGDLSVQRKIVQEYIDRHEEWYCDSKEYFEGGKSAYKNTAIEREELQRILQDAQKREFDILVLYKDDRLGRLMWDTAQFVMQLKSVGVDVYSVKDGKITPDNEDIMGQMMLTFRYANAQKSSADTGMRVKDTAQKLVEKGKFMGGAAPYGYKFTYSGEISKHGRALQKLVIVPEQAEVVEHIFDLSLNKEFGSAKIAKKLNLDDRYKMMAPKDVWKSGTITSILQNPIYTGRTAYKRRERVGGKLRRLDSEEWIVSENVNEEIRIIDEDTWNRTQEKRKQRGDKYTRSLENQNVNIIKRNDGMLPLIDVIYCGYCGCKLTNGSKYNYWTIKGTGERRASKSPIYKCQNAWSGVPHDETNQFRADRIEPVIFEAMASYIGMLQENENVFDEIEKNNDKERIHREAELKKEKAELSKILKNIEVMEEKIPFAMQGKYPLSLEELVTLIKKQKENYEKQKKKIEEKEDILSQNKVSREEWDELRKSIPTWREVFLNADSATKRVLVNKLIERIDIKKDEVIIKFKINLSEFMMNQYPKDLYLEERVLYLDCDSMEQGTGETGKEK